jgi:hypothetical protein
LNNDLLLFILSLIEALRRFQWNFFRLENEHVNNCGQFRAVKDVPLPFILSERQESSLIHRDHEPGSPRTSSDEEEEESFSQLNDEYPRELVNLDELTTQNTLEELIPQDESEIKN